LQESYGYGYDAVGRGLSDNLFQGQGRIQVGGVGHT
jgi:hypothetical protein